MGLRLPVVSSPFATTQPAKARRRVALVCTPFQAVEMPSLALATLARILADLGHEVDVVHLNLDLAVRLGFDRYEEIVDYPSWLRLLGEWMFADDRIAPGAATPGDYRTYLEGHRWRDRARHLERLDLSALRSEADRAVDRWTRTRDWGRYDVVGFSVMFQQLNASLRLARRIKDRWPRVKVALGGTAMEEPMGRPVFERHPWLDAVFSGYSERSFPAWVAELPPRGEGVVRQDADVPMDELPVPDFDPFFRQVREMGLAGAADYTVPIETSRGCWWGERQHCIFCALNGLDMKHRSKSPERALAEIEAQARHRRPFFATDNILPLEFFHGLFERLLASGVPYPAFYETKSNLSLGQLKTLRQVGLWGLQPGIESLSTPILRHMKKGVGAAQNLWILRAAEELGFGVAWSILYGFPQEEPAEYEQMADLLPSLSHLSPPLRPAPVLLERHSPLFEESASYGLRNVRPTTANRAAFGDVPGLGEQAHVFDFEYPDGREPDRYTRRLNQNVLAWRTARRRLGSPRCEVFRVGSLRFVLDSRDASSAGRGRPRLFLLSDAEWELATLTEEITTESKLREKWSDRAPLEPVLRAFLDRRWLVPIDGRLVRVLLVREKPTVAAEVRRAMESGLHRADRALRRVRARLASVGLGS